MSLTDENMVMPVGPMYGNGAGANCGFGGDWAWIILLLLLGWGNNGGFGNNANGYNPWMNQGFQDQRTGAEIAGVRSAVDAGFANAEVAANSRQIANLQQAFNSQTAITGSITNLSSQLAQCCCENRLATQGLQSVIATENCADRQAINEGIRDILANQNAGIQKLLDQMCQDKIDAKNEKIADLERQLTAANLAASQQAQTSRILADNAAQTVALEQYLNPTPVPAYTVPNPNCCQRTASCGF